MLKAHFSSHAVVVVSVSTEYIEIFDLKLGS